MEIKKIPIPKDFGKDPVQGKGRIIMSVISLLVLGLFAYKAIPLHGFLHTICFIAACLVLIVVFVIVSLTIETTGHRKTKNVLVIIAAAATLAAGVLLIIYAVKLPKVLDDLSGDISVSLNTDTYFEGYKANVSGSVKSSSTSVWIDGISLGKGDVISLALNREHELKVTVSGKFYYTDTSKNRNTETLIGSVTETLVIDPSEIEDRLYGKWIYVPIGDETGIRAKVDFQLRRDCPFWDVISK